MLFSPDSEMSDDAASSECSDAFDVPVLQERILVCPPVVKGRPKKILVGRRDSIHKLEKAISADSDAACVRVEIMDEFRMGDAFGPATFGTSWGALLKFIHRPEQAPLLGRPSCADASDVKWTQWLQRSAFFSLLRALGVIQRGSPVPGDAAELEKQCGIVPMRDDLFCGFWCLAHLKKMTLAELFRSLVTELEPESRVDDKKIACGDGRLWLKVWAIASLGLQRLQLASEAGKDWDMPLLPHETAMGSCGHAAAFVLAEMKRLHSVTEIMLTPAELAKLCARLSLRSPIVVVSPAEAYYGDSYAESVLVHAAQKSLARFSELDVDNDAHEEAAKKAVNTLSAEGYHFVVAAIEGLNGRRDCAPLDELRFPAIILLGGHFFVLEGCSGSERTLQRRLSGRRLSGVKRASLGARKDDDSKRRRGSGASSPTATLASSESPLEFICEEASSSQGQ